MILKLSMEDPIDRNIDNAWDRATSWTTHIKSLDSNIRAVDFDPAAGITTIYFFGEEYKNWFVLRWS